MTLLDRALSKKALWTFAAIYLVVSIIVIANNIGYGDTLYYWDWSRHLGASYYDGPPLVAYLLFLHTKIFGSSQASLNLFAVLTHLLIGFLIYQLAKKLFDNRVAKISILIWLTTQFVYIHYVFGMTYDTVLAIFWLATIYFFYRASTTNKTIDFYLTGLCAGLALLGKYQAIILWGALFLLMFISNNYRHMLKNKHTYLAMLMAMLMFSPVIVWNIQHNFISFSYQLGHGFHHQPSWRNISGYFWATFKAYHIFFVVFVYYSLRYARKLFTDPRTEILLYPAWAMFLFFLVCSFYKYTFDWNQAYFLTAAILVAQYVVSRRLVQYLVLLGMVVGLILIINSSLGELIPRLSVTQTKTDKAAYLGIRSIYKKGDVVLAGLYYGAASLAFYLPGQPKVYTVPRQGNQYQYWSQDIIAKIKSGKIKSALYFSFENSDRAAREIFSRCRLIKPIIGEIKGYTKNRRSTFYVFRCDNYGVSRA